MSARRSTGVMLIASGSIGITIGIIISFTGILAICGIPMVLVCIPMVIWGYLMKAKDRDLKDQEFAERMLQTQAVASGVNICPQCRSPNQITSPYCSSCGFAFDPISGPRSISAVDPVEAALLGNQIKNTREPVFEPEDF